MPTRMRLQRHGKKGRPFYHIVIADGRAPRDGRFIEKLGTYDPLTKPADINIDFDKALSWLESGAQPSDTVRAILSYKGLLYKYHLRKGVKKGAMTEEQAEARFQEWLQQKEAKIQSKRNEFLQQSRNEKKKKLETEAKLNQDRSEALARKYAREAAAEAAAEEEAAVQDAVVEAVAEGVVEETAPLTDTGDAPAGITGETAAEPAQEN